MKHAVFSDIDGTLLNSELRITPRTQYAIRALGQRDIPFVIASARSPSGIYPLLNEYGLHCPLIAYSGAVVCDADRNILLQQGFPRQEGVRLLHYIETHFPTVAWNVFSFDKWVTPDRSDPRIIQEEHIVRTAAEEGTADGITADTFHKILCICRPGEAAVLEGQLREKFPAFAMMRSGEAMLEIMAGGVGKGAAARALCTLWRLDPEEAAAFGDNYNDWDMLKAVGHGFLMANAPEALRQQFPRHTADHDSDGIYEALCRLGWIDPM